MNYLVEPISFELKEMVVIFYSDGSLLHYPYCVNEEGEKYFDFSELYNPYLVINLN